MQWPTTICVLSHGTIAISKTTDGIIKHQYYLILILMTSIIIMVNNSFAKSFISALKNGAIDITSF